MMQPNETIQLADLLNGLVELNAVGDNLSPQHFTPPPQRPFQVTAVNGGEVHETLPMELYLRDNRIGSSTFAAIQKSEIALRYEMQNKGNGEQKSYYETGTAVHSYIEAWSAGVGLDTYLKTLNIVPTTFNRTSKDGVTAEIEYFANLLGVVIAPPEKLADMKIVADTLRKECEKKHNFVTEKDAAVITGIAAELQRRHNETSILDWLKYAKSEYTFFYKMYKARPDLLCDGLIVSVKTCAQIDNAAKDAKYKYGVKEAFYRYVLEQVTGKPHETVFLFFETVEPYQSRLIYVSPDTAAFYDLEVERYIAQVTRCIETNTFKGYDAGLEFGCEII